MSENVVNYDVFGAKFGKNDEKHVKTRENVKGARPRRPKISSFIEELALEGPHPGAQGRRAIHGVGLR